MYKDCILPESLQVDRDANLVNAYVSPTRPGRVELEKIGNLADIKRIPIEGIADIQLQEDGKVMWAFGDETEPLAINPLALVQKDAEVCLQAGSGRRCQCGAATCLCLTTFNLHKCVAAA